LVSDFIYAIVALKPRKIVLYMFNTLRNGIVVGGKKTEVLPQIAASPLPFLG